MGRLGIARPYAYRCYFGAKQERVDLPLLQAESIPDALGCQHGSRNPRGGSEPRRLCCAVLPVLSVIDHSIS